MKFLLVALAVFTVCAAQSDDDWARFQAKYGKAYRSADEISTRRAIWEKNWQKINQHNEEFAKGLHTYTLGENQFADMTFEEFSQERLGLSTAVKNMKFDEYHEITGRASRRSVDHRNNGYVTSVKDQGKCGGCWAFAVVAAIEGLHSKKNSINHDANDKIDLSEQQLIDCSKGLLLGIIRRNNGCNGGQLECTYSDVASSGIQSEDSYPYKEANETCKYNSAKATIKISGGVGIRTEAAIIDAVDLDIPVTVGIAVSSNFQLYKSGIYVSTSAENSASLNHAVTVIGYDLDHTIPHYIIKNSWSPQWGEKGYIRLASGSKPLGIDQMASYPK